MPCSRLDRVYRKMVFTKFFTKGWGDPEVWMRLFAFHKLVSNRDTCFQLVSKVHPITVINEIHRSDCKIIEGRFLTPVVSYLADILPPEVENAYFQLVVPLKWKSNNHKSICIHLAGTGDHFFWRRRNFMAKPLLKYDIGSVLLENPFYGLRKPKDQIRSSLHNVSDLVLMGECLILESIALLHWLEGQGYGPLGLSGISMGGHMASLAATNWPKPLVLVPCLSWSSASSCFTEGVMSESIDWNLLQEQYKNDKGFYETMASLVTIIDRSVLSTMSNKGLNEKDEINLMKLLVFGDFMSYKFLSAKQLYYINKVRESKILSSKLIRGLKLRRAHPLLRKPRDAVLFMRAIMDECTHLKNFSVPFDTSLITVVCAQADGYVPRDGCSSLAEIWPGAEIRYLRTGHVSAYILHKHFFRNCIYDTFERAKKKRFKSFIKYAP